MLDWPAAGRLAAAAAARGAAGKTGVLRYCTGVGVSGITRTSKFSAGGNPNNPYIFGKLTSRRSDLAMFNRAKSFSSAVVCSFLKGPYQGIRGLGKKVFTILAKNREKYV